MRAEVVDDSVSSFAVDHVGVEAPAVNRAPSEWPELFDDPLLASAALERLADRVHIVSITGKSYRLARTTDDKELKLTELATPST